MRGTEQIYDRQKERLKTFPADRIPFWNSEQAVKEDMLNIDRYLTEEIDIEALCRLVEWSNFLPEYSVSEHAMQNEIDMIGSVESMKNRRKQYEYGRKGR